MQDIKERLQDFNLRQKLNENQNLVMIFAVVVIAVCGLYIVMRCDSRRPGNISNEAWYYDTVTQTLYVGERDQDPPVTSPDGNPAVRAHMFSCGDCDDKDERFVAFYDKYTDEAKAALEKARTAGEDAEMMYEMAELYDGGVLYSFDGENWWPAEDPEKSMELQERLRCDDGKQARYCRP